MQNRVLIYLPRRPNQTETSAEYLENMTRTIEARGDLVAGVFADNKTTRRHKQNIGWKTLLAEPHGVDQVAVMSVADLPGRTVKDLLHLLGTLRDHGTSLFLLTEGIDSSRGSAFTLLDVIDTFRSVKLSQAIRAGQVKALAAGKTIGRPRVPVSIRDRIRTLVAAGGGIRPAANKFGVAPATVINVCRSMSVSLDSPAR
jgi:DNA invertase Pin-like site-specific DNA recombinase